MDWILASASPRRKELLKDLLSEFSILPSEADERIDGRLSPRAFVKTLAERKAREVACRKECEGKRVIGADTVVAIGKEILGKPKSEEAAFSMLKRLSGKKHFVYTGVCVAWQNRGVCQTKSFVVKTAVYFEKLSDEWIWEYIKTGSPMDKAGAYGIQDGGLVKKIKGSYTNVVGFPVERFEKELKRFYKA